LSINEDYAGFGAIRRSDDPVALHRIEQAGRPPVTNPEPALQDGG